MFSLCKFTIIILQQQKIHHFLDFVYKQLHSYRQIRQKEMRSLVYATTNERIFIALYDMLNLTS